MRFRIFQVLTAIVFAVATFSAQAATVQPDQGQIFGTGGDVWVGDWAHSQSVTTGIAGQLTGIQVQFHNFEQGSNLPPFSTIPTIDFAIYSGANDPSAAQLFFKTFSFQLSDFTSAGLYTFDLLAANLFFNVGDAFSFVFQASAVGFEWAANNTPGYSGGAHYIHPVGGAQYLAGSPDVGFISYVNPGAQPAPVPLPSGLLLYLSAVALVLGFPRALRRWSVNT